MIINSRKTLNHVIPYCLAKVVLKFSDFSFVGMSKDVKDSSMQTYSYNLKL